MKAHYLHVTDLTMSTADDNSSLRRYNNQELHPGNISNIPGLNPSKQSSKDGAQKMLGSSFRRQKQDILTHEEFHATCKTADRVVFSETTTSKPLSTSSTDHEEEVEEIPLIDQMISHSGGDCKRNLRPDLLPVDDKMKLYFAYNKQTRTISRVIATGPRGHFARKEKTLLD